MKFVMRKPSVKKMAKGRSTGKLKRKFLLVNKWVFEIVPL